MDPQAQEALQPLEKDKTLHFLVFAPRFPDPRPFSFKQDTRVGEVAKVASESFGYQAGQPGLQTLTEPPRVLDNSKTLKQEHVHDGERFELVDTGGGV
jgi:hypothetical protein